MGQEELNTKPEAGYEDPIATAAGDKPAKKSKGGASVVASSVAAVIVWRLFGLIGGLICYGGFWAVYGIAKSRLSVAAKIPLCILAALVFLALLFVFIMFAAYMTN